MESLQAVAANLPHGEKYSNLSPEEAADMLLKAKVESTNKLPGSLNEKWPCGRYDCPVCLNRGYVMAIVEDEDGEFTAKSIRCECMNTRQSISRLERSGLKDVTKLYTFKKFQTDAVWQERVKQTAMDYVKAVMDGEPSWFFIGGQSGCGKTHICSAIAVQFIKNHMDTRYMIWRDEMRELKAVVNTPEYTEKLDALKRVKVLYIDDFFKARRDQYGRVNPTDSDAGIAFELLNHRYNDRDLLTIISSELTLEEIADIDEATAGRIAQKSKGYCLTVAADRSKNYRLRGVVTL